MLLDTRSPALDDAIDTLAAAFADDPVLAWLVPPGRRGRDDAIRRYFDIEVRRWGAPRGATWSTPGAESVAIWYPPERPAITTRETVTAFPALLRILGSRSPLAIRGLARIERVRPEEPHWYLHGLGTRPGLRGRGLALQAMTPGLEVADQAGLGCYLEASAPANVPYYRRVGFEVVETVRLPHGPEVWAMWRAPQERR